MKKKRRNNIIKWNKEEENKKKIDVSLIWLDLLTATKWLTWIVELIAFLYFFDKRFKRKGSGRVPMQKPTPYAAFKNFGASSSTLYPFRHGNIFSYVVFCLNPLKADETELPPLPYCSSFLSSFLSFSLSLSLSLSPSLSLCLSLFLILFPSPILFYRWYFTEFHKSWHKVKQKGVGVALRLGKLCHGNMNLEWSLCLEN